MRSVHVILFVADQSASTRFYADVLGIAPTLEVPGMTEFELAPGCVLGLMPRAGARRLLGERVPERADGTADAELYLRVPEPELCHERALRNGATEVSPMRSRDWGDRAAYCVDPDGHVLAFASVGD